MTGGRMLLLDIGGSFLKYALTDAEGHVDPQTVGEAPSHAEGSAEEARGAIREVIDACRGRAALHSAVVAVPDPFDFETGTFWMEHKFRSLYGQSLRPLFAEEGMEVCFVQDTAAYILGVWADGTFGDAACPCLVTLGTGVGFAHMRGGRVCVNADRVPAPILWDSPYLDGIAEDYVSTRAIRAWAGNALSVREMADRARAGDEMCRRAFRETGRHLAAILAPKLRMIGADQLALGGQIARSADLMALELPVSWSVAAHLEDAALRGAAAYARLGGEQCLMMEHESQ